jgi:hypothetical protein
MGQLDDDLDLLRLGHGRLINARSWAASCLDEILHVLLELAVALHGSLLRELDLLGRAGLGERAALLQLGLFKARFLPEHLGLARLHAGLDLGPDRAQLGAQIGERLCLGPSALARPSADSLSKAARSATSAARSLANLSRASASAAFSVAISASYLGRPGFDCPARACPPVGLDPRELALPLCALGLEVLQPLLPRRPGGRALLRTPPWTPRRRPRCRPQARRGPYQALPGALPQPPRASQAPPRVRRGSFSGATQKAPIHGGIPGRDAMGAAAELRRRVEIGVNGLTGIILARIRCRWRTGQESPFRPPVSNCMDRRFGHASPLP